MYIFLIILSILLWIGAIIALRGRQVLAPALSYAGLFVLSLARKDGYQLLPINTTILMGWFAMTLVVMIIVMLQQEAIRRQTRGAIYMIIGAVTGLAVGLLGFTFSANLSLLYAIMVAGVVAGTFCGFLLYTRTPEGAPVGPGSGNFFRYLLAKGFPTAITIMQPGIALVLAIALTTL
ncbi:MAG: hypothetical protein K2K97_09995 [Muribaculaceae bacterium]|nr:hypothetical protein [Muribaculaceae bacterium]